MEAGFCGVPVIASRTGGIVEIIEDGKTGLLVKPEDIDGWTKSLQLLIGNDKLREKLSLSNEIGIQNFNWSISYAKYKEAVKF